MSVVVPLQLLETFPYYPYYFDPPSPTIRDFRVVTYYKMLSMKFTRNYLLISQYHFLYEKYRYLHEEMTNKVSSTA